MYKLKIFTKLRFLTVFIIMGGFLGAGIALAAPVPLTVNLSDTVTVTGNPRIQLDVGGTTRYATFTGGSGTSALTFEYTVQAGDLDRDGITLVSPIDLNGGTITDVNGNNATLTYALPNTSGVLVQAYQVAFTTSPITDSNETAAAFNITGAPIAGATYNYSITSSGGAGSVTGSGSITADPQSVSGINLSSLPAGTLTLSVTVTNATGVGNAKTNTVAANFTGALDSLPASAAAYSIRRLRTAYTGSLIRVRRASDNAEQDIGYTMMGNLNQTTLNSFCGASSCFVKTWYDQSGNARDASQTTNANQPRVTNAGALEVLNTRPAINWIKTSNHFMLTGYVFSLSQATVNATFKPNSITNAQLFDIRSSGGSNPLIDCGNSDGYGARWRNDGGTLYTTAFHTNRNTSAHVTTKTTNGSTLVSSYLDGGDLRTVGTGGSTSGSFRIALGTNGFTPNASATEYNGLMSEFTYFNSVLGTTDRQTLENNQKAYYGTP